MQKKTKRIGVLASGGDSPGMNAAIRAVVQAADEEDIEVFGIRYGFRGLMEGLIIRLDGSMVKNIAHEGGTIIKTSRSKAFMMEEGMNRAVTMSLAYEFDGIITIGGDGTMRGAADLCRRGIRCITLPGTIDNDLAYTDYTIGFDTAVAGVVEELSRIRDTMESHDRIGVVEVMGNKCGDIALFSALASSSEYVLVPEVPFDMEVIAAELTRKAFKGQFASMIVLSEGAGKAAEIADFLAESTRLEVKSVTLGYTQRGGSPTARDRNVASHLGAQAVKLLALGIGNRAVGIKGERVVDIDIMEALQAPKEFRKDLYDLAYTLAR